MSSINYQQWEKCLNIKFTWLFFSSEIFLHIQRARIRARVNLITIQWFTQIYPQAHVKFTCSFELSPLNRYFDTSACFCQYACCKWRLIADIKETFLKWKWKLNFEEIRHRLFLDCRVEIARACMNKINLHSSSLSRTTKKCNFH